MFINLEDEVWLMIFVHQFLEIFDDEGIRSTFKGCDQHRIEILCSGGCSGRFKHPGGIIPWDLPEQQFGLPGLQASGEIISWKKVLIPSLAKISGNAFIHRL